MALGRAAGARAGKIRGGKVDDSKEVEAMKKFTLNARIAQSPVLMRKFLATMERERKHMLQEFGQVRGLMPLLMKQRNKQKWTEQEKLELMTHLKRLSHLSPYVAAVVLPGGFAMLPILAWWLDRRRLRRAMPA
jgi:hypothetical protein